MNLIRPPKARPLFLVLGALLITGAVINGAMTLVFLQTAVRTTGIVTDPGPGGRHAIVEFRLPSGETAGLVAGGFFTSVQVGQAVPVIYDPSRPGRSATLDWTSSLWFLTALMGLIGSGMLSIIWLDRLQP